MVVTRAGRWHYLEYPAVNTAGSHLFEPAAATHAFFVPPNSDEITMMAVAVELVRLLEAVAGAEPLS